ncbi:hypothetical protein K503DRAFT_171798 [Rhizopogon vinicolor AM-OR11-026]|uniref:Uncharacterized protein n=1 Tax=Rhizopogon vinicolor AM-OR11-026 TaxID=1314800 RepID=A0A1B7N097_9AGAM|nr:hypothetical protein K503DRAFT_171798 [Rhizopogon vinicolor AM-OR11-026]
MRGSNLTNNPSKYICTKTVLGCEIPFHQWILFLWNLEDDSALIFPIFATIDQALASGSLCSVPNASSSDMFMNLAQNLIAVSYYVIL